MKSVINYNIVNCVLLVIILIIVIVCCMKKEHYKPPNSDIVKRYRKGSIRYQKAMAKRAKMRAIHNGGNKGRI